MSGSTSSYRSKKVVVPKVWKRPHSTIYGKNAEFGRALYSDKIGEINSRKFNSELPYNVRNTGALNTTTTTHNTGNHYDEGYLSNLFLVPHHSLGMTKPLFGSADSSSSSSGSNRIGSMSYVELLEFTNPNRYSSGRRQRPARTTTSQSKDKRHRIDFYDQYLTDFTKECHQLSEPSLLANEPLLRRRVFNDCLDFDNEIGLFMPANNNNDNNYNHSHHSFTADGRSLMGKHTAHLDNNTDSSSVPMTLLATTTIPTPITKTQQTAPTTYLLPKHECQLSGSPYGQSVDGRKLSLTTISPHLYRPSMPSKTSTAHASDGEEFELHDRSSPFYTDRWAGKTIRHFDSDLYSDAHLFKSMIL